MATNPTGKTPSSYRDYPGKLDHTSIACVRVGTVDSTKAKINPTGTSSDYVSLVSPGQAKEKQQYYPKHATLKMVIDRVTSTVKSRDIKKAPSVAIPSYPAVLAMNTDSGNSFKKRIKHSVSTRGDLSSFTGALRNRLSRKPNIDGQ